MDKITLSLTQEQTETIISSLTQTIKVKDTKISELECSNFFLRMQLDEKKGKEQPE